MLGKTSLTLWAFKMSGLKRQLAFEKTGAHMVCLNSPLLPASRTSVLFQLYLRKNSSYNVSSSFLSKDRA